jgi:Ligase-CoA domain
VLIVTGAGGSGVLLADACTDWGLKLMAMPPDLDAAFRKFIPPFGAAGLNFLTPAIQTSASWRAISMRFPLNLTTSMLLLAGGCSCTNPNLSTPWVSSCRART